MMDLAGLNNESTCLNEWISFWIGGSNQKKLDLSNKQRICMYEYLWI